MENNIEKILYFGQVLFVGGIGKTHRSWFMKNSPGFHRSK